MEEEEEEEDFSFREVVKVDDLFIHNVSGQHKAEPDEQVEVEVCASAQEECRQRWVVLLEGRGRETCRRANQIWV